MIPLRWRRPRLVFVNSMSDLFHHAVPDAFIADVFAVMALAPRHTFQILTKRHARMRALLTSNDFAWTVWHAILRLGRQENLQTPTHVEQVFGQGRTTVTMTALPNVWLGVSVEDQKWADIRIPALLATPAAVRFISAEPLLGSIDLGNLRCPFAPHPDDAASCDTCKGTRSGAALLDWVIAGGESGVGARPMHPDWARQLRDQCIAADVPFVFKQWGCWVPNGHGSGLANPGFIYVPDSMTPPPWDCRMQRTTKTKAGRLLDGREWDQYPTPPTGGAQ